MLGQTFVYHDKALPINDLRTHLGQWSGPENPSESLVESGLRHPAGKTFRAGEEDGLRAARRLRL
jgi:hypothetical protein